MKKLVFFFGNKQTEGNASEKYILGGKGANLAEMSKIGIPVPPGFTISTEVCKSFNENNQKYPANKAGFLSKYLYYLFHLKSAR